MGIAITKEDFEFRLKVLKGEIKGHFAFGNEFSWLTQNPNTDPEILRKLYESHNKNHTNSILELDLAGNPNTPPNILSELSLVDYKHLKGFNPSWLLKLKLVENPNTPSWVIDNVPDGIKSRAWNGEKWYDNIYDGGQKS